MAKFQVLYKNDSIEESNRKLLEETGEVLMAQTSEDRITEVLDVMQVCIGELQRYSDLGFNVEEAISTHNLKLKERGWDILRCINLDI